VTDAPAKVRLHAVGDVGIVGRVARELADRPPPHPFQGIMPALAAADIVFGNLEIPFSGGARIASHESAELETPEAAVDRLSAAGFHVLSIANNHVMDFGATGLSRTREILEARGIACVGAGADLAEARRPVLLERKGLRVGFLAYSTPYAGSARPDRPGAAPLELDLVREDLARLRRAADRVVVSVHFGMMYLEHPTPDDMVIARAIREAGADVVVGHHPHVLQGIEASAQGIIAYSLGELVFDPRAGNYYARVARDTRRRSLILRADLGRDTTELVTPLPTSSGDDHCPRLVEGADAEAALEKLDRLSAALHDPDFRRCFWEYAGQQLMAYEASGLWDEIRRGELRHFVSRLPRLRPRHLKLVLGFLRSSMARIRTGNASPAESRGKP
jgi:poly-gamma-glutamate synthesis protein (capsule biosynthesis protein)